jgi:hypothetical protein
VVPTLVAQEDSAAGPRVRCNYPGSRPPQNLALGDLQPGGHRSLVRAFPHTAGTLARVGRCEAREVDVDARARMSRQDGCMTVALRCLRASWLLRH